MKAQRDAPAHRGRIAQAERLVIVRARLWAATPFRGTELDDELHNAVLALEAALKGDAGA